MSVQQLRISGMTCAACQQHVRKALESVPGVRTAKVNLLAHTAEVDAQDGVEIAALQGAVKRAGYEAFTQDGKAVAADPESRSLGLRALLSLIAGAAAMISMPLMPATRMQPLRWVLCLLAAATIVFGAPEIYLAAWRAARHRATNMNTLVALGTISAFLASLAATVAPGWFQRHGLSADVYFEAVILILAFLLSGRWLEARARERATSALRGFAELEATDARLLASATETTHEFEAEQETLLPVDAVEVGDYVRVLPGDRIPLDGVIVSGRSSIDESMLTGEPLPVTREAGAAISGGTLNLDGVLVMKATALGADSAVAQMRRLLEQAQNTRAPMEKLADRASAIFVPAVLLLAAATFALWAFVGLRHHDATAFSHALLVAISVLIIACPCAMGLAVPAAITVAIGRAAQAGLLIKGGDALERLATIDMIALDKTGTLTEGRPQIVAMACSSANANALQLTAYAAAIESFSTHPLAKAVLAFYESSPEKLPLAAVQNVQVLPGIGITANVDGKAMTLGNASILQAPLPASLQPPSHATHATPLFLVIEGELQAAFYAMDELRPTAVEAIAALKRLHVQPLLLTGDTALSAAPIAAAAGISDVRAHLLPAAKLDALRELQAQGKRVAMVGDGINDAAALAQADAGLAMASGTQLAREAGDILLLHPDLRLLPLAVQISRRTVRIMRQNLGWAMAYNIVGIPIAAGVLYPHFHLLLSPVLASAAMALSSVSVLANSLRLKHLPTSFRRPR